MSKFSIVFWDTPNHMKCLCIVEGLYDLFRGVWYLLYQLKISFPLFLICSNSLFCRNGDNSENWKKNWNLRIQRSYLKWYGASDNSSMIGGSCLTHLKIIFFINGIGNPMVFFFFAPVCLGILSLSTPSTRITKSDIIKANLSWRTVNLSQMFLSSG